MLEDIIYGIFPGKPAPIVPGKSYPIVPGRHNPIVPKEDIDKFREGIVVPSKVYKPENSGIYNPGYNL